MELARIISIELLPGPALRLRFADGASGVADLASLVERGGVFASLGRTVPRLIEQGRAVAWDDPDGEEADMDADTLRQMITPARAAAE